MLDWLFPRPKTDIVNALNELEKTRIERELAIREAIVERKNAFKLAQARERFIWTASTGIGVAVMSVAASFYHKNIFYSTGVIPAIGLVAYEAHNAYGRKLDAIFFEMERIFGDTRQKLSTRTISVREIDSRVADIISSDIISSPEILD